MCGNFLISAIKLHNAKNVNYYDYFCDLELQVPTETVSLDGLGWEYHRISYVFFIFVNYLYIYCLI